MSKITAAIIATALLALGAQTAVPATAAEMPAAQAVTAKGVRNVAVAAREPAGFRRIDGRSVGAFKAGEAIFVYAEPVDLGFTRRRGTPLRLMVEISVEVIDGSGRTVQPASGWTFLGKLVETGREEAFVTHEMRVPELPAGSYTLKVTLRDFATREEASATTALEIVSGTPSAAMPTMPRG